MAELSLKDKLMQRVNDAFQKTAEMRKTQNDFVRNYRQALNPDDSIQETTAIDLGNGTSSNNITFRNAKVGEKTGLQKISLLKSNGDKEDIFLIVPERESVGYGEIRGWNSPGDQNMPLTKSLWESGKDVESRHRNNSGLAAAEQGATALATPFSAAADLLAGNAIMNNITKNERSNYTGPDKAVGLGNTGASAGQIFGMVSSDGEIITPTEALYFLKNLKNNGYKGIYSIEQPKKVQEHTGPAYVPGDILLGLLGLQPNRGAVGYTFKEPATNTEYQNFIKNLRNSEGK